MSLPEYTNTNLIINYLIKIELSLEKIRRIPLPRTYLDELREDVLTDDIEHLSQLIDYPVGSDEARKVYLGKVLPSSRSKLLILNNYRNSLEFARNYDHTNYVLPSSELILHINQITGNKIAESWEAGKMRTLSEKPVDIFDSWYKLRDYYPGMIFEDHFDELMRFFHLDESRIPFYIRCALFTYEMIDKAPLVVTNQITTISTIASISTDNDYNPNSTVPYAKVFNYIKDDIGPAFKMSKSRRHLTPFIEAFLYSLSVHLMELEDIYTHTFENKVKKHGALNHKYNKRQIKALDFLEHTNRITREEYAKMMGVSFMTAYRDIQELLEQEYLEKQGVGRGTYYTLRTPEIEEQKEEELEVFGDIG